MLLRALAALLALAAGAGATSCELALQSACGGVAPAVACGVCAGRRQRQLRLAGCSDATIREYCQHVGGGCAVYVSSVNGSDASPGTSPSTAVATLSAGLASARKQRHGAGGAPPRCTIRVAGTHVLNATLQLWKADSYTTLTAWDGAPAPTISGGAAVPAASWRLWQGGWGADISPLLRSAAIDPSSGWQPSALFAGRRLRRVRTPVLHWDAPLANYTTDAGQDVCRWGFVYSPGDIPDDWDLSAGALRLWRVVGFHQWSKSYHTVRAVFRENRTILFEQPAPFYYGQVRPSPSLPASSNCLSSLRSCSSAESEAAVCAGSSWRTPPPASATTSRAPRSCP